MILNDFSQLVIAGCLVFPTEFKKGGDVLKMENIARHSTLSSILNYKRQYSSKCGVPVICCDGKNNWRKQVFPQYKGKRRESKVESDTDWSSINSIMDTLREEIAEMFPYKVIQVDEAEADDVIAILTKYSQTNELIREGLEESPQKVMNISGDHDFQQLYKYLNYAQFSPMQKKVVPRPTKNELLEKLLTGDSGDGVPNVRMPDNTFMDGVRQKPITAKMKEAFFANPDGSTLLEEERVHLERNKKLISFDYIPVDVENKIIHAYENFEIKGTQNKVFEYFIEKRCRNLMPHIAEFF